MENIIERLEYFMSQKGLNDNRLTTEAGLSVGLIGKARKVRKGLHSDTIEKILYAYPELNPIWFTMNKGSWDDAQLNAQPNAQQSENKSLENTPTVQFLPQVITVTPDNRDVIAIVPFKAAAGYLNGYSDPEFVENLPTISAPGYRDGLHRAFEIRGNSMPPLHSGSYSIGRYQESMTGIRNRRVYIVISKTEGIVIKRVINMPEDKRLVLISDNSNKREFPNYTMDYEDVKEIWEWRGALINAIPDPSDLYNRLNDMEGKLALLMENFEQSKGKGTGSIKQIE